MEFQEVIEKRYSCRSFSDAMPSRSDIEAVLNAGRLAPTACNSQPQRIYVVQGEENLTKLDACTPCRYGAPVALVIGYSLDEAVSHDPTRMGGSAFGFGELDMTSVLVHMALKASDLGLATCWLGAIDDIGLRDAFGIPESVVVRAVLDLGYASEQGVPSPRHTDRKDLKETVTWLESQG